MIIILDQSCETIEASLLTSVKVHKVEGVFEDRSLFGYYDGIAKFGTIDSSSSRTKKKICETLIFIADNLVNPK